MDKPNPQFYMKETFDATPFIADSKDSGDYNTASRIRNLLADAISDKLLLPKFIVMVLDDDIIEYFNYDGKGTTEQLGRIINWIMSEHEDIIKGYKAELPARALKANYPQLIWIEAPYHKNFKNNESREIFNKIVSKTTHKCDFTTTLQLKKIWNEENRGLYLRDEDRYTSDGYTAYWQAVDRTVKFADTILFRKITRPPVQKRDDRDQHHHDKFHWRRNSGNNNWNGNRGHQRTFTR